MLLLLFAEESLLSLGPDKFWLRCLSVCEVWKVILLACDEQTLHGSNSTYIIRDKSTQPHVTTKIIAFF